MRPWNLEAQADRAKAKAYLAKALQHECEGHLAGPPIEVERRAHCVAFAINRASDHALDDGALRHEITALQLPQQQIRLCEVVRPHLADSALYVVRLIKMRNGLLEPTFEILLIALYHDLLRMEQFDPTDPDQCSDPDEFYRFVIKFAIATVFCNDRLLNAVRGVNGQEQQQVHLRRYVTLALDQAVKVAIELIEGNGFTDDFAVVNQRLDEAMPATRESLKLVSTLVSRALGSAGASQEHLDPNERRTHAELVETLGGTVPLAKKNRRRLAKLKSLGQLSDEELDILETFWVGDRSRDATACQCGNKCPNTCEFDCGEYIRQTRDLLDRLRRFLDANGWLRSPLPPGRLTTVMHRPEEYEFLTYLTTYYFQKPEEPLFLRGCVIGLYRMVGQYVFLEEKAKRSL